MKRIELWISLVLLVIACTHDPVETLDPVNTTTTPTDTTDIDSVSNCDTSIVYFQEEVLPIFKGSCALSTCHDAASAKRGVILESYDDIVSHVEANNSDSSLIYRVISDLEPSRTMPRNWVTNARQKMDQASIDKITKWIDQGALNNSCSDLAVCDTSQYLFSNDIMPIFNNYCNTCHGAYSSGVPDLTNYDSIKAAINEINIELFTDNTMPKGNPSALPECDKTKIKNWIDNGAQDN